MKGIILAGGRGIRLYPLTLGISKQLLPVYNKPMIYYPLCMLMFAGIREVLIISTPEDLPLFRRVLGDGSRLGMIFHYAIQDVPRGLADAFLVGRDFVGKSPAALVLGDNLFYGHGLPKTIAKAAQVDQGAYIFAYPVHNPEQYGVVEFDRNGIAISLEEKPKSPKSKYAVPGIYFYDHQVVELAGQLRPSSRGELEVTDLNRLYLKKKQLQVEVLGRGIAWLDAGTPESLLQASNFVQAVEERQGLMISCPEEIAFRMGFIDAGQFQKLGEELKGMSYGKYLLRILEEGI